VSLTRLEQEASASPLRAGGRGAQADAALAANKPGPRDLYTAYSDGSALCDSKSGTHYRLHVAWARTPAERGFALVFHLDAPTGEMYPNESACVAAGHGRRCRHRADLAAALNHFLVRRLTAMMRDWTAEVAIPAHPCFVCGAKTAEMALTGQCGGPCRFRACLNPECALTGPFGGRKL